MSWDNEGYIQVPQEGDGAGRRAIGGLFSGLNAAPDPRLVALNSQKKGENKLVTMIREENAGYEVQSENSGPSIVRRVAGTLRNLSAAPAPTPDDEDNAELDRVRREARLALKQKGLVADAERKFEEGQAGKDARYKARMERAVRKGYEKGLRDNDSAEWREEKMIEAKGFAVNVAKGGVSGVKKFAEFVGRKVFKKGNGRTVDSRFVNED